MRLATLAERERIGRDLHDLLGHTLSVVALKSELARKLIDRDLDAARSEIGEVERVARDALSQVRNAVSGIRSTALSAELVAATALLEAQGVKVKCETENVKLPHDRETALALSLREAATNIRRHSGASGVTIRVQQGTDRGGGRSGGRRPRRAHRARQWAQRHARAARQCRRHALADVQQGRRNAAARIGSPSPHDSHPPRGRPGHGAWRARRAAQDGARHRSAGRGRRWHAGAVGMPAAASRTSWSPTSRCPA